MYIETGDHRARAHVNYIYCHLCEENHIMYAILLCKTTHHVYCNIHTCTYIHVVVCGHIIVKLMTVHIITVMIIISIIIIIIIISMMGYTISSDGH